MNDALHTNPLAVGGSEIPCCQPQPATSGIRESMECSRDVLTDMTAFVAGDAEMQRTRIKVEGALGSEFVSAYKVGEHFAVHRGVEGFINQDPNNWRVTHIPSGWAAGRPGDDNYATRRAAIDRVREIEAMDVDWSESDPEKLSKAITDVLARSQHTGDAA